MNGISGFNPSTPENIQWTLPFWAPGSSIISIKGAIYRNCLNCFSYCKMLNVIANSVYPDHSVVSDLLLAKLGFVWFTVNVLKFLTLHHTFLAWISLFMHLFHKIVGGMASSIDPNQTAPSDLSLHYFHMPFSRNNGVWNFRTLTVIQFLICKTNYLSSAMSLLKKQHNKKQQKLVHTGVLTKLPSQRTRNSSKPVLTEIGDSSKLIQDPNLQIIHTGIHIVCFNP